MSDVKKFITDLKEKIDHELSFILKNYTRPNSLYEPASYALKIGGKRLRPILCYLVYRALTGDKKKLLYPALGVELLHTFTLVHDDIMDNDNLRRGQETVHKKWDLATGVLSGDALVSMAYDVLLKEDLPNIVDVVRVFAKGIVEVCEGQSLDSEFEDKDSVSEEEYLEMIDKKTAALLRVPAVIGALISKASNELIEIIKDYATNLGLAFQIQDDMLDILADEKLLGKTFGSDISEGKKTFLYIKALELFPEDSKIEYLKILNKRNNNREEHLIVKEFYSKFGVFKSAEKEAQNRIDKAYAALDKLNKYCDIYELKMFTDFILKRRY